MHGTFPRSAEQESVAKVTARVIRYSALALVSWSLLIAASLSWTIAKQRETTLALATNTARANFNKDVAYRLWASSHGGVYVEPTEKTPPSPWLAHIPDRDLVTKDGRLLTLMNPAYMLREMMQDYGSLYGIKGRIVGIVALNPNNLADPWEAEGIRQFSAGKKDEILEVSDIDGAPFLRLLRPFRMEHSCQKCHGHLGFKDGDVRGAIGVSVPLAPYRASEQAVIRTMMGGHGVIWILGVTAIGLLSRRSHSRQSAAARMALALQDRERHYRAIVETSSDGFWMTDPAGRIVEVNRAYLERSGYTREQLLSMRVTDLEARADEDAVRWRIAEIMAGRARRFETRHRTRDGEIWDVEVSSSYFPGGDGRLFVFLRDISERKQAERVLADSEQRFREMAETIDQVFFVASPDYSRFHYISPAFRRLWGRDGADLMVNPRLWLDWLHPEDHDAVVNFVATHLGSGEYESDFRIVRPDGAVRWLHAKSFEVAATEEGGAPYVLGFHSDVTAAKTVEEELRDMNDALSRSNADLEAYAYVASHDLREPLRNVTSFSTLLARRLGDRLDGEERELVGIITDAANRMDCLVRDLLEVSRVGRDGKHLVPVSLARLAEDARAGLRSQMEAAHAGMDIASPLPTVLGNEDELYRLLLNLFGNALKYHGADPVRITVDCKEDGPERWRITIADNGIGLQPGQGYEERIFGLFQRLHQRDEYGGGTGIGLPVCRKIVNRHGGRIWAESDGPGKGTRFIFTLPKLAD